jgi:RNA polymerase sigma-70 factor (ECF subfamily)
MPRYREDGPSFGAWLFAIAHNVVVDEWRARQGGGHATPWIENVAATVDAALDPEESTLIAEEVREVRTLLSRLPADQAQLIELRLAGLTDKEIAFVLGRSHGAVRVAQYRAIRRLRGLLGIGPLPQESRDA